MLRKRLGIILVLGGLLFFLPSGNLHAVPVSAPRSYQPIGDTGVFSIFGTKTTPKNHLAVGIAGDFAKFKQNTLSLQMAYGISRWFELGIDVPYTWWKSGDHKVNDIDDINLGLKYRFFDEKGGAPSAGTVLFVTLPSAPRSKGLGSGEPDLGGKLIMSKRLGPVKGILNFGYTVVGDKGNQNLKNETTYGFGIDFSMARQVHLLGEIVGNRNRFAGKAEPLEGRLGFRFISDSGVVATVGGGYGMTDASPDYRMLFSVTFMFPAEKRRVIRVTEPEELPVPIAPPPKVPEVRAPAPPLKERVIKIILEDVHFEFDKSSLTALAKEILNENAKKIEGLKGFKIIIEGHADERGTTEYNLALGEKRARSVKDYLVTLGIEDSRTKTVSYGEERPLDSGHNERAWTLNRRAHFVIEVE